MSHLNFHTAGLALRDLPLASAIGFGGPVAVALAQPVVAVLLLVVVLVSLLGRVLLIEVIGHIPGG